MAKIGRKLASALCWNPLWTLAAALLICGCCLCGISCDFVRAGAICIESAALCLLYGLVVCALKITHSWPNFRKTKVSLWQVCVFILISAFTTFFVLRRAINDHSVYTYDHSNYWKITIDQSTAFLSNPFDALRDLYRSILDSEYNSFIALFMVLPLQVLGNSFAGYALTIQVLFNLPALWIISTAGQKLLEKMDVELPWLMCYAVASLCPTTFPPSAYSMPDSFVLIFVSILLLFAIDFDWHKPQKSHIVMMGIVLFLCMIARRYFVYFNISFVILLVVSGIESVMRAKKKKRKDALLHFAGAFIAIGVIALGILYVFFNPLLMRYLHNNYRFSYSYFSHGVNILGKFRILMKRYGYAVLVPCLLGALFGVSKKRTRGFITGLLLGMFLSCYLFFQIQIMDKHHCLITSCQISLLMIMCMGLLLQKGNAAIVRRTLAVGCTLLFAANFVIGWSNLPKTYNFHNLFRTERYVPDQRSDLRELHNLADRANSLAGEDGSVYLLSMNYRLNVDTLKYLDYPYSFGAVKNQEQTHDIDLRDGFPEAFPKCKVVITVDPIEKAGDQYVISALAQHFIDGTGFARHYERLESFQLDGGITATVYRRFEDWTAEDYDQLRAEFEGYYPDYPELFADRIHP